MRNPLLSTRRPEYDEFLRILVNSRKESGVSQRELAKRVGRTQGYVSKVESGSQRMDVIELLDYCQAIGTQASILIFKLEASISKDNPA